MYNWEKSMKDRRYRHEKQNPSFSSSLLDKIYRSIEESDPRCEELRFRRETMVKKQIRSWTVEEEEVLSLRQACLLDKWMEENAREKLSVRQRHQSWSELDKKSSKFDHDYDRRDALFFSSGSNSSESSSGGLSSSDTEYFYNPKPSKSCFSRSRPIGARSEKTERRANTLFYEQRELHVIDDYHFNSATDQPTPKSKSRAMKIYGNLKNLKQPISPGGRLASFLNSIFTGTSKKSKNPSPTVDMNTHRSVQESTCSSASSLSRSCLSKNSPASRERLRNGVKRSVRFCPVSVIVDENLRPCGQKSVHEELEPKSLRIRETEVKLQALEKRRKVEEAARNFLKQYHEKQHRRSYDEDDDDDASCASSDLFELDHLAVMGSQELPVYESTRIDPSLAGCLCNCRLTPPNQIQ